MLLQMLARAPVLKPQLPHTIQSVCLNNLPDIIPQLAMWDIPTNNVRAATFFRELQTLSPHHEGISQTGKSYNSSFSKWASWCAVRDRNPILGPISDVANY